MKILYLHQHFSTPNGSTGIRSYEMAKGLVDKGHNVTVLCGSFKGGGSGLNAEFINGKRVGQISNINVIEYDLTYSNNDSFFKRTRTFIKYALAGSSYALKEEYDIIFCSSTPLTASIPGILASRIRKKKFIFEVRDLWPELPKEMGVIKNPVILKLMDWLETLAYRSATNLVALAPGIKKGIESKVPKKNVKLIPNGCDFDIFENFDMTDFELPVCVQEGDLLAVYAGTHGIANGLDLLVETARVLSARGVNDIKLLLVGDGKLKQALVTQAESYNLENIIFLDPLTKTQLAALFKKVDIGLQILKDIPAFHYGTSPNKFFDYISASLPVICNYKGWVSDMIIENEGGYVVEQSTPEQLADKLVLAKFEKALLKDKGQNMKVLALKEFDRKSLVDKLVETVEQAR